MNIVITLPREIIAEIIDERRWVLVRRFVPNRFNIDEDVVLVVEKGTKNIPILFSIKQFLIYGKTSIIHDWLAYSLLKDEKVYNWVIGRVCFLKNHGNAASRIGIKNNPTTFVYYNYDVAQFQLCKSFWGRKVNGEDKSYVYAPDKRNMVIREYLASDCENDYLQWCEDNKIPFNWRGMQLK